ncbi:MAG: EVE domain-containing protein [Planctomycetota bacterium]
MARSYWLFKSEPDVYSFADLERDGRTHWEGVRNFQARNLLRDEIKQGDGVLYYHSNAKPMAIVGVAKVVAEGYPDHTAFDAKAKYYDPKSDPGAPTWFMVDVAPVAAFPEPLTRDELKEVPELSAMMLLRRGARLSVQPVTADEWNVVLKLAGVKVKL